MNGYVGEYNPQDVHAEGFKGGMPRYQQLLNGSAKILCVCDKEKMEEIM